MYQIRDHQNRDLRIMVFVILIALTLFLDILLSLTFRQSQQETIDSYIEELNTQYIITIGVYSTMADSIFQLYINTAEIKEIMARAVTADNAGEKTRLREELYQTLLPLYERITGYNFRQLHFHEPDNRSFLRFHKPEKFGDDLTGIRYSVEYTNREKKPISGFEEGRIFNGYRFIFPIEYMDKHIGSVEVSVSLNTVVANLKERFNQESQFILLKSQVEKKVFAEEESNYSIWQIDNRFVLDKAISESCILEGRITDEGKETITKALTASLETGNPECIRITIDDKKTCLTLLPINNFLDEEVAFILSVSSDDKFREQLVSFVFIFTALNLLLFLLIAFSVYYYKTQKKMESLAIFDFLTQTYSRAVLFNKIEVEFHRYQRYKKTFSLIMIDLDHFKRINDSYGHGVGDIVLKGVSDIIKTRIRTSDIVGRYGGEEFIVLLPETGKNEAVIAAENLRSSVFSHSFQEAGTVSISCGVTEMHQGIKTVENLINEADKNLYKAKKKGRNTVVS